MPLDNFRQICLPYCIRRTKDLWVVLNREYMPLGFSEQEYDLIDRIPVRYDFKGIGPEALKKIGHSHNEDGTEIFLYDDGCLPDASKKNWDVYQDRLWQLRKFEKR